MDFKTEEKEAETCENKMQDEIDAIFHKAFGDSNTTSSINIPHIDKTADDYNMNYPKRGSAIIFNHYIFDDKELRPREGTDKDVETMVPVFKNLGFDVDVHHDLKYGEIYDILNKAAKTDYSDTACLLVVVMSHGDRGEIHARDHTYNPETLWLPFAGDECPTLAGKPKMFFIQACRGASVDSGAKVTTDARARRVYTIPSMADILVMYGSYDGFFSWRSPYYGSWFIQSLCKELKEHGKKKDLLSILTLVNRRMAIDYQSNVPRNYDLHHKKQIGSINSTFTRFLYFYPEQNKI